MSIDGRIARLFALLRRHPLLWGLGLLTLLALLAAPLVARLRDPLQRFWLDHRTIDARMVGFDYAPLRVTRGTSSSLTDQAETHALLADLQTRVSEHRTPENLRRLALAELMTGGNSDALGLLKEALAAEPDDPSILSDLAAAELAAGRVSDAAEHSAMALELDPSLAEAAFTWAAAMERFSNRPAAIDGWQRYLMIDDRGPWADEARERLAGLQRPQFTWAEERKALVAGADAATIKRLVAKYPYHARLRILNILLPNWANTGDPAVFALMRAMAAEKATADPYLLDAVEHAGRVRESTVPAVLQFRAALDAFDSGQFDRATISFSEAARIYESAGSPLWIVSAIYAATTASYAGKPDEAMARIERVETRLAAFNGRYPSMASDAIWLRGLLHGRAGFPALALDAFRQATADARRSGEIEQETAAQHLVAAALEISGDPYEAEQVRIAAFRSSDAISVDRDRMFGAYGDAAYAYLKSGKPRVARAFAASQMFMADQEADAIVRAASDLTDRARRDHAFANAREIRDRWGADSDVRRALAVLEIGRVDAAAYAIASARARAMTISDAGYRARLLGDVDFAAGRIEQRRGRTAAAIAAFTSAIANWETQQWRLHTAGGYLARAEAHRAAGDRRAAESDYRSGLEDMEAQRNGLEPELRIAYFERSEHLFERFIELLVEEERIADALTIAERKRARVLLEQVAAGEAATPLDAERIRAALPADAALIEITLLEKYAELWLVHKGRITHARSTATRKSIEDAVTRHRVAIDAGDEQRLKREGRWLYDELLAPVAARLPDDTRLVVVADGNLFSMPFATLVMPDGRYLLDRFTLSSAPSASIFLRPTAPHSYDSLLAVAQPQPGDMQPLRGAASEAKAAAERHARGKYATGTAVRPAEFLESAGEVACVHFAGHAKTEAEHPSRSALLFETSAGPAEELTAAEIASRRLPSEPLVVLAACSTARGKLRRNEGIQSLAAAFLQAGARGVVATLWDVDDAQSAKLYRSFHAQLRKGARPADALRSAQRALLHGAEARDRLPAVWASAVLEGAL